MKDIDSDRSLGPVASATGEQFRNRLLAGLPGRELELLRPHLHRIPTRLREVFYDPESPISHVWFVESGLGSLLSTMTDGSAVEAATVGAEGMVGMPVFHGVDRSAEQAMVQIAGSVYRLDAAVFTELLPSLPTLNRRLSRYAAFQFTLAAQGSGCNRKHTVAQRCARWLLIVTDQVGTTELGLTHEFVSQMLGVRRASVTETLAVFQKLGLLETRRARLTVADREGMEAITCGCYGIIRAAASRMTDRWGESSALADVVSSRKGLSVLGENARVASSADASGTA